MRKLLLSFLLVIALGLPAWGAVMGPDGAMVEYYGRPAFYSQQVFTTERGPSIVIEVFTNYPITEIDYNKADVRITFRGGSYGIKTTGPDVGLIVRNPVWETSAQFIPIGEYARYPTGEYIPVRAVGGTPVGHAVVLQDALPDGRYRLTTIIPKKLLEGRVGDVEWSTAQCGNSVVSHSYDLPGRESCPPATYPIPTWENNNPVVPFYNPTFPASPWGFPGGNWWPDDIIYPPYYPPAPPVPVPNLLPVVGMLLVLLKKRCS
jgi:hypothetical protein